jgi:hypothetical protein
VVAQRVFGSNLIVVATSPVGEVLAGRSVLRWQILILGFGVLLLLVGGIVFLNSTEKQKMAILLARRKEEQLESLPPVNPAPFS